MPDPAEALKWCQEMQRHWANQRPEDSFSLMYSNDIDSHLYQAEKALKLAQHLSPGHVPETPDSLGVVDAHVTVRIALSQKDVENWIYQCEDEAALKRIIQAAKYMLTSLENPDNDDFRSRA